MFNFAPNRDPKEPQIQTPGFDLRFTISGKRISTPSFLATTSSKQNKEKAGPVEEQQAKESVLKPQQQTLPHKEPISSPEKVVFKVPQPLVKKYDKHGNTELITILTPLTIEALNTRNK